MYNASIIINTYNGNQEWLNEAVESCLGQKNVNIQLIVSTVKGDPSIRLLKKYSKIDFCINDRPGIYLQLNNALKFIKNEWFAYAAGDDIVFNTKIYEEIEICLKNNKKICSSGFVVTDEKLNKIAKRGKNRLYSLKDNLKSNFVSDCSLIHKSVLDKFAPFSLECGNHAFWDFWIRVARKNSNYFIFDETSRWSYRQHAEAKHLKRVKDKSKIKKNEKERKIMLRRHEDLLKKFNLEHLLKINKYK